MVHSDCNLCPLSSLHVLGVCILVVTYFFFLALTHVAKKLFIQGRDIAVESVVVLHVEEKQSVIMRTCLYYVAPAVL